MSLPKEAGARMHLLRAGLAGLVAACGATMCLLFVVVDRVSAANPLVIDRVSQQDLDGDGHVDLTVIDCAFVTAHDRILVFDRNGDMVQSDDWRFATDFVDDVWIYDIGAKGAASLIVAYGAENGHQTSDVYDDQDGDGAVSYTVEGASVRVTESRFWTVRIASDSNWFRSDGSLDLNIKMELDGPVWALDSGGAFRQTFDRMPASYAHRYMQHDGVVDAVFSETADASGIAENALTRLESDSPPGSSFQRTAFLSNDGRYPTRSREDAFFPFLPAGRAGGTEVRYFDVPPTVDVDWQAGKVRGMWLDGYPIGHGFHANVNLGLQTGKANGVDFEAMQAYYDLNRRRDAFPELHIRVLDRPPDDPTLWTPPTKGSLPWEAVRYSWNVSKQDELVWDYKLGLAGAYPFDAVSTWAGYAVRMVPFEELPQWVLDRPWSLRTFVAREGKGYQSSEGIYDWDALVGEDPTSRDNPTLDAQAASLEYMMGTTVVPPNAYYENVREGFRAERNLDAPGDARLYFSAIDRKLHLVGARYGIWNIASSRSIRYGNLTGGRYLDTWDYLEDGVPLRSLYAAEPYLVYSDDNAVEIKEAASPFTEYEVSPPATADEWRVFPRASSSASDASAPEDFKAMIDRLAGPSLTISQANVHEFRSTDDGFRFVIDLRPGFEVEGRDLLGLADRSPGTYVVTYDNAFSIEPLTPPRLRAEIVDLVTTTRLHPTNITVALTNDGQDDASDVAVEVTASAPGSRSPGVIATEAVSVFGGARTTAILSWAPPSAGTWILVPRIRQPDGSLVEGRPVQVQVLPSPSDGPTSVLTTSTEPERIPVIAGALIILALIPVLIIRPVLAEQQRH